MLKLNILEKIQRIFLFDYNVDSLSAMALGDASTKKNNCQEWKIFFLKSKNDLRKCYTTF